MRRDIIDLLYTGDYISLCVYIYDVSETDEYKFYANVAPSDAHFDGKDIRLTVTSQDSHMEVEIPLGENIKYHKYSDCYEYVVDGKRYELYF